MIDRALNLGNTQADSFYFQLYPINLAIVDKNSVMPEPGTTYKFAIFKAQQKFDQNKVPIDAAYQLVEGVNIMAIPRSPLNFYIPQFTKGRKVQFTLKLYQYEGGQQFDVGEMLVQCDDFIKNFNSDKITRYERKTIIEDYELEYEIYVQKSRFALEKVVKQFKVERSNKSPIKERRDGSVSSTKKSSQIGSKVASKVEQIRSREEATQKSLASSEVTQPKVTQPKESKPIKMTTSKTYQPAVSKIQPPPAPPKSEQSDHLDVQQNKSETNSRQSKPKSMIVATKLRPVIAHEHRPSQVKLSSSQIFRSGTHTDAPVEKKESLSAGKEHYLMMLFLAVSVIIMYIVMQPNRKV